MSKQKILYCETCQKEVAIHICPSVGCIKPQNNKLSCFKCYVDQHANNEIAKHKPLTKNDLQSSAIEKQRVYIKFQEQCLKENLELQEKYERDLDNIFNKIFQWHGNQKKLLKEQIETANTILMDNIKQAETVLQDPTIDLLLFFHFNIDNTIQQNYEKKKKIFNRNRKHEIMKLDYRTQQLTNNNLIFTKVLNLEKTNYQLSSIISQEVDIVQCQSHKKKNKYICTHPDCLSQDNQKLYCKMCMKSDHKCHEFKQFGKLVGEICKEVEDKKKFIVDLNAQKQNEVFIQIDKNFEQIWNTHKKIQEESNSILSNLFLIEQHSFENFDQIQKEAFSQGLLNGKLISKTKEQINQQFQATYEGFKQKMELDLKNSKKDLLSKCQQIDGKFINLEQEISKLQLQIFQQNRTIINQEKIIREQSSENQFNQMKSSLDVIISNQNQQSKQSVEKLQIIQDSLKKLNDINYNNEFKQQKQLLENLIHNQNTQNQQSIQRHKEVQDVQTQLSQLTQTKSKEYLDQQKIILTEMNQQASKLENLKSILNNMILNSNKESQKINSMKQQYYQKLIPSTNQITTQDLQTRPINDPIQDQQAKLNRHSNSIYSLLGNKYSQSQINFTSQNTSNYQSSLQSSRIKTTEDDHDTQDNKSRIRCPTVYVSSQLEVKQKNNQEDIVNAKPNDALKTPFTKK